LLPRQRREPRSLFVQVIVEREGEPIVHFLGGGGTLRVDPPAPSKPTAAPTAAAPPTAPAPAAPAAAPKKPLSRLEQLRQEAQPKSDAAKPATDKPGGGSR
jgi:hypothetical protein